MKRFIDAGKWLWHVFGTAFVRFYVDDGFSRAAGLAYTSLLALLPVAALSFSVFNVFGGDPQEVLRTILDQFLPARENEAIIALQQNIFEYINNFVVAFNNQKTALNILSVGVLVFTGIALLNTIESALNSIWRVSSTRSIFTTIASFWSVITLGPLLIGFSIYLTTRSFLLSELSLLDSSTMKFFGFFIPVCISSAALTLLFYLLPSVRVRLKDAFFGAFVAAILFEVVKLGFAYYVGRTTTYNAIYGVLAAVPLFLVWIYVTWVVVLFGAQITYLAGSVRILSGRRRYATDLGEMGALLGLRTLLIIGKRFVDGATPPSDGEIAMETGVDPPLIRSCLELMSQAGLVSAEHPDSYTRSLLLAPDKLSLGMVFNTFLSRQEQKRNTVGESTFNEIQSETAFLETIRNASLQNTDRLSLDSWTLADILLGQKGATV